jgi:hypothetical protein
MWTKGNDACVQDRCLEKTSRPVIFIIFTIHYFQGHHIASRLAGCLADLQDVLLLFASEGDN